MLTVSDSINARKGLASTRELIEDGADRASIRHALASGEIQRVRQGWYAVRHLHPTLVRAARVGGRLSCSSALQLTGAWVHHDSHLHVAVAARSCRLRSPDSASRHLHTADPVVVHWTDASTGGSRVMVDDLTALSQFAACAGPELVAASADSLLRRDPTLRSSLLALADGLTPPYRRALHQTDGVCESGIETLFWIRMRRFAPRRQVKLAPGIRVDFVIGARLVVEVDGEEFHSGALDFETDRRRDAALSVLGYRVLRFSYRQIMFEWPSVEAAVRAAVARGDHY